MDAGPEGPAGDRVVTASRGLVVAAPSSGAGKTTVATGLMAALRARGLRGQPAQGRPRLHRPRLPRARHRPARPQPRPGAGRRGPDRAAVPARRARARTSRSSRASWACTTGAARPTRARPRTSPGCSTPPSCSSSTRRRSRVGRRAGARLRARTTRGCASPAWSSTGSAATGTSSCCARRSRDVPGARRAAPRRRRRAARPPPRPGARRRARARGGRDGRAPRRAGRARRCDVDALLRARPHGAGPLAARAVGRRRSSSGADRPVVAVAGGPAFTFAYAETAELLTAAGRRGRASSTRCATSACRRGTAGLVAPRRLPRGATPTSWRPTRRCSPTSRGTPRPAAGHAECAGLLLLCRTSTACRWRRAARRGPRMTPAARRWATATPAAVDGRPGWATRPGRRPRVPPHGVEPRGGRRTGLALPTAAARASLQDACASYLHLHPAGVRRRRRAGRRDGARWRREADRRGGRARATRSWSPSRPSGCCRRPTWWSCR